MSGLGDIQMVPVHQPPSMEGVEGSVRFAYQPEGFVASPTQADRWINPREGMCTANDNTCKAKATKASRESSTPLCAGHARSVKGDEE